MHTLCWHAINHLRPTPVSPYQDPFLLFWHLPEPLSLPSTRFRAWVSLLIRGKDEVGLSLSTNGSTRLLITGKLYQEWSELELEPKLDNLPAALLQPHSTIPLPSSYLQLLRHYNPPDSCRSAAFHPLYSCTTQFYSTLRYPCRLHLHPPSTNSRRGDTLSLTHMYHLPSTHCVSKIFSLVFYLKNVYL